MKLNLKIILTLAAVGCTCWLGITVARSQTNTNKNLFGDLRVGSVAPSSDLAISGEDRKVWLKLNLKQRPTVTNQNWAATNVVMQTDCEPRVTRSNQFWIITFESKPK